VLAAFEGEGARTSDNVAEMEIVTYDGARLAVGRRRRKSSSASSRREEEREKSSGA